MVWYTTLHKNKDNEYCAIRGGLIATKNGHGLKTFQAISSLMFKTIVEMSTPPNFPHIFGNSISLIAVPNYIRFNDLYNHLNNTRTVATFDLTTAVHHESDRQYVCESTCGEYEFVTCVEHYHGNRASVPGTDSGAGAGAESVPGRDDTPRHTYVYCMTIRQLPLRHHQLDRTSNQNPTM